MFQNFLPKLKEHLLSRFLDENEPDGSNCPQILFKNDRIYEHSLCRVNYTTYDVRRDQDTINSSSSHCNVMVLSKDLDPITSQETISYRYARVLGTYHANVMFVGRGMVDYSPIRMEFLWVRWYELVGKCHLPWSARKMDRLRFPPLADEDSFGFIDPNDVLRGCHVIPAFSQGRRHPGGSGISLLAKDASDWKEYYLNR